MSSSSFKVTEFGLDEAKVHHQQSHPEREQLSRQANTLTLTLKEVRRSIYNIQS